MGQNRAAMHSRWSFGRNLVDARRFDRCAMPQIQQTRGDHPLPRLQAPKYGITVAQQGPKLHRGLNRKLGVGRLLPHRLQVGPARPALKLGAAAHHIDKTLAGELADGGARRGLPRCQE